MDDTWILPIRLSPDRDLSIGKLVYKIEENFALNTE